MHQDGNQPNKKDRRGALLAGAAILALLVPATGASPAGSMVRMTGHIPYKQIAQAQDLGRMDPTARMTLSLPIKLRDPAGLESRIKRIYDPSDSLYKKFLTPAQTTEQFAATPESVAAIASTLTNMGLNVTEIHPGRGYIKFEGSVAAVQQAFQTEIHQYQTSDGSIGFAPVADPLVSETLASQIHGVLGLHQGLIKPHHHLRQMFTDSTLLPQTQCPAANPAPVGGMAPAEVRNVYNLSSTSLNGAGETLGLYELDGFQNSDIKAYTDQYGLTATFPVSKLTVAKIPGASGTPSSLTCTSNAAEVTLDIEMMIALAPGVTNMIVYEGPNSGNPSDYMALLTKIESDDLATSISTSWAFAEADWVSGDSGYLDSENQEFQLMAAHGQSYFAAAGDSGDMNQSQTNPAVGVEDPGSQPYVTGVGGLSLDNEGSGNYTGESIWNNSYGGGGGGISGYWQVPTYQANLATAANGGNSSYRSVPDISLNADPVTGYSYFFGTGQWGQIGGTSAAAPLWAAFTSMINQQRVAAFGASGRLGFVNPTFYQLAEGPLGAQAFHDTTAGNNGAYHAVPGFDLASGWGSFNGANFLQAFTTNQLVPSTPFNFKVQTVSP